MTAQLSQTSANDYKGSLGPSRIESTINIPAALYEIGTLLELKKARSFHARAYKKAAQTLSHLETSLTTLIQENRLQSISGIGNAIASQIEELYLHGTSRMLEQLRRDLPRGAMELATVPGLTLARIKLLQDGLGIASVADLKAACEEGRVRTIKGFGPKTEAKLLANISQTKTPITETHIHKALRFAEELISYLKLEPAVQEAEICGALRRWCETVPDLRIALCSERPAAVIQHFAACPLVVRIIESTKQSCVAIVSTGMKFTLVVTSAAYWGLLLVEETGSDSHLTRLKEIAETKNVAEIFEERADMELPDEGTKFSNFTSELSVYESLGLDLIPPELRENQGEIEASMSGELPHNLVTLQDIKGMVHCHTNYSDGKHTIEEMARAAESLGMTYLTITDHSPTAFYAGGLEIDRLRRQWDEIEEVQEKLPIKILRGTESDILADGSLDYPDEVLEQFDVIIASIHSRYRMDEARMTERIIRAMRYPVFKIWGHGLGRLIQHRPPFDARVEEILDVIAESKAAIEINGDPYRLDLEPRWIRQARKREIKFVISTDAHSINGLKNLKFGVGTARRGWVERDEVLNTLSRDFFIDAVRPGLS